MKKIILIITGSIAAPKALDLYNLLSKKYEVTILVTPSAKKFVKFPKGLKIHDDLLAQDFYQKGDHINHIDFAYQTDLIVVYPATLTFISKAALGICDNLPLATFFASTAKKIIFPAMNNNMYHNLALQRNLTLLAQDTNIQVTEPDRGLLATRITGDGRLKEPAVAMQMVEACEQASSELSDKTVLINYGATRAYLDDLRYLTNDSSGKMGQAVVQACLTKGAKVVAVVGDVSVPLISHPNLTIIRANTNETMLQAMQQHFKQVDIAICVAALSDYQVAERWQGKIKKTENQTLQVKLVGNVDVLASLGKEKTKQLLIGFSAQDSTDATIAKTKMVQKNCDGMIMNHLSVMNQDQTAVEFYFKNESYQFKGSKIEVAKEIVQVVAKQLTK